MPEALKGIDDLTIATRDGVELAATHFGTGGEPRRVVVINGALGVPRSFYQRFASHLQEQGIAVVTYDYRGMGDSLDRPVRESSATIEQWGYLDFEAVLGWLADTYPDAERCVVGHSVGAQIIGLSQRSLELTRIVGVAAQSAYWGHWSGPARLGLYGLWHVLMPAVTHLLGYFPGRLINLNANLPAGVALDWARWGRDRNYLRSPRVGPASQFFAEIAAPVMIWLIEDDPFAPRAAVEAFMDWFVAADTQLSMAPPLGHSGWFTEPAHWQATVDFLRA